MKKPKITERRVKPNTSSAIVRFVGFRYMDLHQWSIERWVPPYKQVGLCHLSLNPTYVFIFIIELTLSKQKIGSE